MRLRIATWNMDHWKRMKADPSGASQRQAWDYLASLGADVALVQEAVPPPFTDPATWSVRAHPPADRPDAWFIHAVWRRWGSAVAIFNPWIRFDAVDAVPLGGGEPRYTGRLWISHPGTWAGVRLTLPRVSRRTADRSPPACGPAPDWRHVRTYRHDDKPNGHPGQIDVVFATKALAASMVSCVAVDDEQA